MASVIYIHQRAKSHDLKQRCTSYRAAWSPLFQPQLSPRPRLTVRFVNGAGRVVARVPSWALAVLRPSDPFSEVALLPMLAVRSVPSPPGTEPDPLLSIGRPCNLTICRYAFPHVGSNRLSGRMLVDFEQIQKAQAGDDAAFNRVVLAYRKRILGTIARLIGRPEDVEDVAQEVFLRLYFSLDQLRTAEVFEPWLYRLTVNASYDYLRRQRRRNESRMADLSEQQVIMADASAGGKQNSEQQRRNQAKELVDYLLESVSEEDRILLTLKEVEGLSLKELEKIYSVNENALKVRLFRARQRVLKAFDASRGKGSKLQVADE